MSKVLVVYFSRTGYTEKVAERMADRCGADIEGIRESRGRLGFLAYLRSAREAIRGEPAEINPLLHDFKDYEVVVFGTPVWAGHVSSPMRACLDQHKASLRRVAFFCTQNASGGKKVLAEMAAICGKQPETTLIVNDPEIRQAAYRPKLDRFIQALGVPATA